jgi:hypothetical protein
LWQAILGYAELADDNAVDPLGHGSTVWMQDLDPAEPLRHAMHVDVSVAREHVDARLGGVDTQRSRRQPGVPLRVARRGHRLSFHDSVVASLG